MKKEIVLSTTEHIPNVNYEILGLVIEKVNNINDFKKAFNMAIKGLIKEARELGADAVIGIKPDPTWGNHCYIGTAIRFIKK